ncbi:hypothetical protein [Aestuariibaculum lutulentum]|uniref:Uncharacterized protein n=1 Tax=Aestuariibaculum lutulentum TaxID=2920935 RepID=A0ABS9RLT7_9FLAO|nr:hypothetical protein [Aestuariibaculum lutulentum]MCH4553900.1 hypothetical protein [Aestuariibaculum lutulentum]
MKRIDKFKIRKEAYSLLKGKVNYQVCQGIYYLQDFKGLTDLTKCNNLDPVIEFLSQIKPNHKFSISKGTSLKGFHSIMDLRMHLN